MTNQAEKPCPCGADDHNNRQNWKPEWIMPHALNCPKRPVPPLFADPKGCPNEPAKPAEPPKCPPCSIAECDGVSHWHGAQAYPCPNNAIKSSPRRGHGMCTTCNPEPTPPPPVEPGSEPSGRTMTLQTQTPGGQPKSEPYEVAFKILEPALGIVCEDPACDLPRDHALSHRLRKDWVNPSKPKSEPPMGPCPVCGPFGKPYRTRTVNGTQMYLIGCDSCGIQLKAAWYRGEDRPTKDLDNLWNRAHDALKSERDALAAKVERLEDLIVGKSDGDAVRDEDGLFRYRQRDRTKHEAAHEAFEDEADAIRARRQKEQSNG